MKPSITLRRVGPDDVQACIDGLADLLIDCVEGGASISFMWPLARDKALAFWHKVACGVVSGERALLVAQDSAGRIVGTAQLVLAQPENQPHRADVAKVLVLDTVTGSDGDGLYAAIGWTRVGVVPRYALMPDGAICDATIFYKHV